MACSQCGSKRGHLPGCPAQGPQTGGTHAGSRKKGHTRGYRGKHEKTTQCKFTWSTPRPPGAPAVGHYDHACINESLEDSEYCSGRHTCRNFLCHETNG